MTQSYYGPDGIQHDFPDDASASEVSGMMNKLYSGPPASAAVPGGGATPSPPPLGKSATWYDPNSAMFRESGDPAGSISTINSSSMPSPASEDYVGRQMLSRLAGTPMPSRPGLPAPIDPFTQGAGDPFAASRQPDASMLSPSFTQRLMSNLSGIGEGTIAESTAMQDPSFDRVAADSASFGFADRAMAALKGTDVTAERAKTQAAYDRLGPVAGPAASMTGFMLNPVNLVPGVGEAGIAGRIAGGAAMGAGMGGLSAYGHGTDVPEGVVIGGATGAAIPAVTGAISKAAGTAANYLREGFGGKVTPPTTAELQAASPAPADVNSAKSAAALSKHLDIVQANADAGGPSVGSQMSSLLQQDAKTGRSPLQDMGFDPVRDKDVFDAVKQGVNPSPAVNYALQHPFRAGAVLGFPIIAGMHASGVPLEASAVAGPITGEGIAHLAGYLGGQQISNQSTGNALLDIRRAAAGQPTTGGIQNWANQPSANAALRSLILGGAYGY